MHSDVVLKVEALQTQFDTRRGLVRAVDGVDFSLRRGEVLGIVGESVFGCRCSLPAASDRGVSNCGGSVRFRHICCVSSGAITRSFLGS